MKPTPQQIVNHMMQNDQFSTWLGIQILEVAVGYSKISMTIRPEMVNGFGIVHGGVTFSLADSAFAFACNNYNNVSVALDTSINFLKAVHVGDTLTAEAKEIHHGKKRSKSSSQDSDSCGQGDTCTTSWYSTWTTRYSDHGVRKAVQRCN